jgi:hypothetical protein
VLKFSYNSILSTISLRVKKTKYTISGQITEAAFDELYKAGKMEELRESIQKSKDIDTDNTE